MRETKNQMRSPTLHSLITLRVVIIDVPNKVSNLGQVSPP